MTDIEKLCETIGGFPLIGQAICGENTETPENNEADSGDENNSDILKGTPLEEINNQLKEQLVGTPIENLGVEPIYLIAGSGALILIFIFIILIIILGLVYYFYFTDSVVDDIQPILRQYEFPIPPPPPPPPVNFVMDNNIIKK